jgi:hypothetical protein
VKGISLGEGDKMKYLLRSVACSSLLLFAATVSAQDRDRDRDRDRDDDRYHRMNRDEGWWRGHLFQRVREDLDHVQMVTFRFSPDQYRLNRVKTELNELQTKYEARSYAQPELDEVIGALSRVVADNHLSPRDRDTLSDDLNRLREFREHHEGYR